jgi:hypothetical protein
MKRGEQIPGRVVHSISTGSSRRDGVGPPWWRVFVAVRAVPRPPMGPAAFMLRANKGKSLLVTVTRMR